MNAVPPMKALRLEVTVDGHDPADLARNFRDAADVVEHHGTTLEPGWSYISGGGWWACITRRSEMTADAYEAALLEWHQATRNRGGAE